jgi:signal transduction histidine kinase
LVGVVRRLSMVRDLGGVMEIVRRAARELTGADGATFVLADGEMCYYADEDAIAPLWKGKRFPMSACVSGWVMRNRRAAVIPDIYADERVPADAYRPTFVKSMAMAPIRTESPLGAIGNYWATATTPTPEQVAVLQALADTTSVAMENVRLYGELEQRVKDRTRELEAANRELEAFSYSVSHDLRAPLRAIRGFTARVREEHGVQIGGDGVALLDRVAAAGERMGLLIDSLLMLSRLTRQPLKRERLDLTEMAWGIVGALRSEAPAREVRVEIATGLGAHADAGLVRVAMENLLSNAWKYTAKTGEGRIEVGAIRAEGAPEVYFVRDNGAGFDMEEAGHLFAPFQRLHPVDEFPGSGVGLATVLRVVHRHGGRIWAEAARGRGATFYFTLGE